MGYCIDFEEGSIKIKRKNMRLALEKLSNFFSDGGELKYVNGFILDLNEPIDLYEIWYDLRYGFIENDAEYKINDFLGEKIGDDLKLFQLIAEYCEDGYLQFNGEDGEHFRIVVKDGSAEEKWAKLNWD